MSNERKKNEIPRGSNTTLRAYYVLHVVVIIIVLIAMRAKISPSVTYFGSSKTRLCGTRPRSRNDRLRRFDLSSLNMFFSEKKNKNSRTRRRSKVANTPDYIVRFVNVLTII